MGDSSTTPETGGSEGDSRSLPADAQPQPAGDLYVASLLNGFFESGWSVQVLLGDADQAQFESSRIARPEAEKHLKRMAEIARDLPEEVRALMPKVDWQSWIDLGEHLPPANARSRALVWTAISAWLPPAGSEMRRYRRQYPHLWRFKL